MPRIPDDVIERLKREVSLEKMAGARGVELTRHGADLIGRSTTTTNPRWSSARRRICGTAWERATPEARRSTG